MGALPLLILAVLGVSALAAHDDERLAACLFANKLYNFSMVSAPSTSDADLVNSGIHNLRFTDAALAKPAAIIYPSNMVNLRAAVLCAVNTSHDVRLRSGGHSYEGISSSGDPSVPFVVISLSSLNRVHVNMSSATAWVEAGTTLGELYYEVAAASNGSLAFSAGTCPTVGTGGHIAGGGFGLLSRKYGVAADNVLDALLIDHRGRILHRSSMGEDVFWALRGGGGGSWGAVYAWKLKLVPVPSRVTVFDLYRQGSMQQIAELVYEWQAIAPQLPEELFISSTISGGGDSSTAAAEFVGQFLGPKTEAMAILESRFPVVGINESDFKEMSWIEAVVVHAYLPENSTVSDLTDRQMTDRSYYKAKSDYVKEPIAAEDLEKVLGKISEQSNAYMILDPYGGAMETISNAEIAFPHRAGNLYSIQYMISWAKEDDARRRVEYMDWMRSMYDFMAPYVSKNPREAYVNYLDLDLGTNKPNGTACGDAVDVARIWGEKYFAGNYGRLVQAKTIIDPNNVFHNPQSIPPLPPPNCNQNRA